ncbi:MAG: hypothetical protein COB67_12770, partial [SAR324 cluster bacterium]
FILLLALGSWIWMWRRLLSIPVPKTKPRYFLGALSFIVFLLALVVGGRGGFQAKPIVENAAFRNPILVLGHLSLNAPFTVLHQLTQREVKKIDWLPKKEAQERTRQLLQSIENSEYPTEKYTFYRKSLQEPSSSPTSNYNVVFLIMESWPAHTTGVLGSKIKGVTPQFDALSKKGKLFTRFISNGTRSIEGIASSLMSISALPDIALIMSGFEQNKMVSLADLLDKRSYDTLFLHGIYRGSFGMHEFARRSGYKKVLAQEDFPDYPAKSDGTWGIWDHIQYERMIEEIDQMKKPFFSTFFSVSHHEPFVVPEKRFNHFPESVKDHEWLNTLYYTDWALGYFFEMASKKDWYENTLFIITADHTISGRADRVMDSARIPLLLFTPSGVIPPSVDNQIGSQVDLVPTIMDFLDIKEPHNSMGVSLLREHPEKRFGLFSSGTTTWFKDGTAYQFAEDRLLGAYNFEDDWTFKKGLTDLQSEAHQENIKAYQAYLQSAQNSLLENTIAP